MPNKENIRIWVEALRSGEYEQHIGDLRRGDKYCALGVACDLFAPDYWYQRSPRNWLSEGTGSSLGHTTRKALGLPPQPEISGKEISELNDDDELNFNQIADRIEDEWL